MQRCNLCFPAHSEATGPGGVTAAASGMLPLCTGDELHTVHCSMQISSGQRSGNAETLLLPARQLHR